MPAQVRENRYVPPALRGKDGMDVRCLFPADFDEHPALCTQIALRLCRDDAVSRQSVPFVCQSKSRFMVAQFRLHMLHLARRQIGWI